MKTSKKHQALLSNLAEAAALLREVGAASTLWMQTPAILTCKAVTTGGATKCSSSSSASRRTPRAPKGVTTMMSTSR
ncbi:MAG: hypothetical protein LBF67_03060 [Prevotellaceae bacterium]|nr:hypothetical protein [Prevotellaceae bacterium]